MSHKAIAISRYLCITALIAAISGCGKSPQAAPPAPEVSIITVTPASVSIVSELPGRISPVRIAEVRARATGILLKRLFEEGSDVREGDALFEIDPLPLRAELANSKATLAKSQATLEQNQAQAKRLKELLKIDAVSREEVEAANARLAQNVAEVEAAQAAVDTATLNLGYATVRAPISGRIGKAMVTEGALVSAAEATQLAVINQLDNMYFDFTQSSTDVLKLRRALAEGKLTKLPTGAARISLRLEDGTTYAETGQMLFSDVSVDETTGMITLRALFPNPQRELLAGMFARGTLEQAVKEQALTVPQRTVTRGADGSATVLIVNGENKVERRTIQTEGADGNRWIISSGLSAGDRIIAEGSQRAPIGTVVRTIDFVDPSAPRQAPVQTALKQNS